MVTFNTINLKKAVALASVSSEINVADTAVRMATYDGQRYPEGRIPLNIHAKNAMSVQDLRRLENFLRAVWSRDLFVQIGFEQKQLTLFVYETNSI